MERALAPEVNTAVSGDITGDRGKEGVIAFKTKQPNTPEVRYHRPKRDWKVGKRSARMESLGDPYTQGFKTWVKLADQDGDKGMFPVVSESVSDWGEARFLTLWSKGQPTTMSDTEAQPQVDESIGCTSTAESSPYKTRTLSLEVYSAEMDERKIGRKGDGSVSKPAQPIWNLKGKSVDEILSDLEALKNDPDKPMPIIEADPASIDDFQQYAKGLSDKDAGDRPGDEEEEMVKDKDSLVELKRRSGMCRVELKPSAFPEDLWPFVMNEQKTLVPERWKGYDPDTIHQDVEKLLQELKVSEERQYARPYFQAQALANIDRYLVKGKNKVTPMIHEKFTHKMELIPGSRPRKELPQRFSETQNAFLKAKLEILEREGRIIQREGLEKSDWLHRLVLVENAPKMAAFRAKHGDNIQQALNDPANSYEVSQLCRLTVDCREINKCLVVEPYPMPDINIGKENIIGSRYMSTSDAADAFYTVPIREEDYGKTTFAALGKQWAFKVMLQGGINSARHYARVITETFDGVPRSKILPYQDDAVVHAKVLLEAIENQQLLYDHIRPNSIMLKPSKTRIGYSSTKFLGDIYTLTGRLPDPSRVECILRMDRKPRTLKEVRHIVGLLVWNIEFIPNGMGILSYLTDLMRKGVDIAAEWKEDVHGKAIDKLKAALASAPCLKPIDVTRPFRVHVDACKNGRGIGAVLLQEYDGQWRPCSYFSRALTPAQRQWSATELEAHALVTAARHWERYLQNGHKWTAIVDHKALIYLVVKRTKTNNTRLLNSVMHLQGHYFDIAHRNGEEHFDADAVSRILQSGDIEEALEAADTEEPDDKEVTIRDLRNLNQMLKLQLSQFEAAQRFTPQVSGAGAEIVAETHMSEKQETSWHSNITTEGELLIPDLFNLNGDDNDEEAQLTAETHTADEIDEDSQDKAEAITAWNEKRNMGLEEAQEKAREAQKQLLAKHHGTSSSSSRGHTSDEEGRTGDDTEGDQNFQPAGSESGNQKEFLVQSGPHRWTPATMTEYVEQYLPLEGELWVHPRTKRLYEITTVFFYEKYQVAAAYSRVKDGGQSDPTDKYPHRIDGKLGLAELVKEFKASGGSLGSSRTRWPKSEADWALLQEDDLIWKPIILKLKEERQEMISRLPTPPPKMTKEEAAHYEEEKRKIRTYGKHKGKTLVYDGVLFTEPIPMRQRLQYVVPQALTLNVMELYHDSRGHPGAERTVDTIRLTYWWPGLVVNVDEHVKSCKACARRKANNRNPAAPIQEYESPDMPWQRVHVDLTGPLTETKKGNKYIMIVKDSLTRYVETMPLKTKEAHETAQALIDGIIYRHGGMGLLISDNGTEFENRLWAQITQLLQIKHNMITPYNPRANGLAENHMRTLKDAISIYCDETQEDWDDHLRGVTMSYNTTVNSQTGFTPFYMMFGREARLPTEVWQRQFIKSRGILQAVQDLVLSLVRVWDIVSSKKPEEVKKMQQGQRPIRHLKFAEYEEGEYAMICVVPKSTAIEWIDDKYRRVSQKLQLRYAGPYLIVKRISPVVYVLKIDGSERIFHAVNMKPYKGKKDQLTPYVEPGYERLEAGKVRKPETPLLLSPDPTLNEKAGTQYRKKKDSTRALSRKKNAKQARETRDTETQIRLSQVEPEDYRLLVDLPDVMVDVNSDDEDQSDDDDDEAFETGSTLLQDDTDALEEVNVIRLEKGDRRTATEIGNILMRNNATDDILKLEGEQLEG